MAQEADTAETSATSASLSPPTTAQPTNTAAPKQSNGLESRGVVSQPLPWEIPVRKSGIGAIAGVHVDVESGGTAGFVAASLAIDGWLDIMLGAIAGKHIAGYLGARAFVFDEQFSPVVSVGALSFLTNPSDVGLRAGAGVAWSPYDNFSVVAEIATEWYPRNDSTYKRNLLVPSLSLEGRL